MDARAFGPRGRELPLEIGDIAIEVIELEQLSIDPRLLHLDLPLLPVHELTRSHLPTVTPDESLDIVLHKFSTHDAQSLAVLDDTGEGDVRGLITRSRLMARYQAVLSKD